MELSFCTGDIIQVHGDMDDDGFYIGEIGGVRGLVPSNFLTDAPPQVSQISRRATLLKASNGTPPTLGMRKYEKLFRTLRIELNKYEMQGPTSFLQENR